MRRIAVVFGTLSLSLSAVACGDSGGGGKVAPDATTSTGDTTVSGGGDTTASNDTTATTSTPDSSATTTSTQDTSVTPDTVQDNGEGLCEGIFQCAVDECNGITDQTAAQACIQTCASAADSQAEVQAFSASLTCQGDCLPDLPEGQDAPTPEEEKAIYACLLDNCVDAQRDCDAGTDFGTKTCQQLNGCLTACGADGSVRCQRDCYEASTEDAATAYVSIGFCVYSQCADKSGAAFSTCASQAQQNPPCKTYVDQCIGGIVGGASPGAGGGGGAEFNFDEAAMKAGIKALRGARHH